MHPQTPITRRQVYAVFYYQPLKMFYQIVLHNIENITKTIVLAFD